MVDAGLNRGAVCAALAVYWGLGCAANSPAPSSPAPSSPAPASLAPAAVSPSLAGPTGFGDGFRVIEARGQGLAFPLPDPRGWRLDKRETHSWVARHRGSGSELVVRAWRFDGIARPEDCEREARSRRAELPEFRATEIVESSAQTLADGYRCRLSVGVRQASAGSAELHGHALAFGSDARSCLMLAFSTSATGPRARQVVAERLSTITHAVFERAQRLNIEGRVVVPPR